MTITPEISVAIAFAIFVILVLWKGTRKITEGLDTVSYTHLTLPTISDV